MALIREDLKHSQRRVLVFTKDSDTCAWLKRLLIEFEIPAEEISGKLSTHQRDEIFNKLQMNKIRVLIATDIASRGLNTTNICHVINYDFPYHMSDYIHRTGRVGRVGSAIQGHVTSFVAKKNEVALVQLIEVFGLTFCLIYIALSAIPYPLVYTVTVSFFMKQFYV